VRVNGCVVRTLGALVQREDRVEIDGAAIVPVERCRYVVLHKPAGVVTTMRDPQGRRTVADLLPAGPRIVPVGRLDYDTAGVLLLTNDGDLAHRLLHPRYGVEKRYRARIRGHLSAGEAARLAAGVRLDGYRTAPARLRIVAARSDCSVVELALREGRNRQVRRMFEHLGHPVLDLVRVAFGPITLGSLAPGHYRSLTPLERAALARVRGQASLA
jgi:23S rRNA pseudouridine2605 synthase